jgi:hypothetical protein
VSSIRTGALGLGCLVLLWSSGCSAGWTTWEQCNDDADCPGQDWSCRNGTCIAPADAGPMDDGAPGDSDAGPGPCDTLPAACDVLVSCTVRAEMAQCGDCPEGGFSGNGSVGCKPLLTNLVVSAGKLVPDFAREVVDYTWVTGMAPASPTLTPSADDRVSMLLDDATIVSGMPDSISLDPYAEHTSMLELSVPNGRHNDVSIRTRRDWLGRDADTLRASNRGADDEFGKALALSEKVLVVGARFESSNLVGADNDDAPRSGAVYVFDVAGAAAREVNVLKEPMPVAEQEFGTSVAASSGLIAVGIPRESSTARGIDDATHDEGAPGSGAVWTFARSRGNEWSWKSYVKSANSDALDAFGNSVAMHEDYLIVGAPYEQSASPTDPTDNSHFDGSGAAYVFERSGETLQQVAYLKAPVPNPEAEFGYAVAVNKGFFAVGARSDEGSGSVFVYREADGDIVFDGKLKASNADPGDTFGYAVAISGNTVVVGAPGEASDGEDPNGAPGAGAAYVFERQDGTWSQVALLKSPVPRELDDFGRRVAICGDNIVIGAPQQDSSAQLLSKLEDEAATDSGALFVARRSAPPGPKWRVVSTLKPQVSQPGSQLGGAVACDADLVVGGLSGDSGARPVLTGAGAVQIYR